MKIVELVLTCHAMPAQWEGRLEDNNYIYVRYRFDCLSFGVGATGNEACRNSCGNYIETPGTGGSGGDMTTREMLAYLETEGFTFDGDPETIPERPTLYIIARDGVEGRTSKVIRR